MALLKLLHPPEAVPDAGPERHLRRCTVPPPHRCRASAAAGLRRRMSVPRSDRLAAARRPRVGAADLRRLHRGPHLPARRGLTSPGEGASEATCKPSSVQRRAPRGRSSIYGRRLPAAFSGRPEGRATPPVPVAEATVPPSYLALLRVEFARFTRRPGSRRDGGSSLWHWSSPRGGRVLPATLRRGARTFLAPPGHPRGPRPSGRLAGRWMLRAPMRTRPAAPPGPSGRPPRP